MLELLLYTYGASACIVLATGIYCSARDGHWFDEPMADLVEPAFWPVLNTVLVVFCLYILWEDVVEWVKSRSAP